MKIPQKLKDRHSTYNDYMLKLRACTDAKLRREIQNELSELLNEWSLEDEQGCTPKRQFTDARFEI